MTAPNLVAIDACILINFIRVGRLDLLINCPGIKFVITEEVLSELTDEGQRTEILAGIDGGQFERFAIQKLNTVERFADLATVMGKGEASAIAAAESEGWFIATDEGSRARRTINEGACAGRLMTTPGILLHLLKSNVLTIDDADAIKTELEGHRFLMNFKSFRDLIK